MALPPSGSVIHLPPAGTSSAGRKHSVDVVRSSIQVFRRLVSTAPFGSKSHEFDHSARMLRNLGMIGDQNLNMRVLAAAIVLHDVGVFYSQDQSHGALSAEKIRPHTGELGLSHDEGELLCSIVRAHDDSSFVDNSKEAAALRLLDSLDAFSLIGAYRYLEIYTRRGLEPPMIFSQAARDMESRFKGMGNGFLSSHQFYAVDAAVRRGTEALMEMFEDSTVGNNDASVVLRKLIAEEWDLEFLGHVESEQDLAGSPAALAFFKGLRGELESYK